MAIKTQLSLKQLTGSVVDLAPEALAQGETKDAAAHGDLKDVLKYYAQAIANIHGDAEFGAAGIATFKGDDNNINKFGFDGSNPVMHLTADDAGVIIDSKVNNADIVFKVKSDDVAEVPVFSILGATPAIRLDSQNPIEFGSADRQMKYDGTHIAITNASGDLRIEGTVLQVTASTDFGSTINVGGAANFEAPVTMQDDLGVLGDAAIDGMLVVTGAAEFKSAVDMESTLDVAGALDVLGGARIESGLIVSGAAELDSTLLVKSDAEIQGNVEIDGTSLLRSDVSMESALYVTGAATFKSAVDMESTLDVVGALDVLGGARIESGLVVSGAAELDSTLLVKSDAEIQGNLEIDGTSLLRGAVSMEDVLHVTGAATFKAAVDMESTLDVTGALDVLGGARIESGLIVSGAAELDSTLLVKSDAEIQGNLEVDGTSLLRGAVSMEDILHVTGAATFKAAVDMESTLDVAGAVDILGGARIESGLILSGAADISGSAVVRENLTVNGTITVDGDASLGSGLVVEGDQVDIKGNLWVTGSSDFLGAVTMESTLNVGGNATFESNIDLSNDDAELIIGNTWEGFLHHSASGNTLHMHSDQKLKLSAADDFDMLSDAMIYISGAEGISFQVADGTAFDYSGFGLSASSPILLSAGTDAADLQTEFNADNITVLGAIASLKNSVNSLEQQATPTLFTAGIASPVAAGSAVALTKFAGDADDFTTALAPNEAEVYVNGQLLLSGAIADVEAGNADYYIAGTSEVKFGFALEIDDRITVIDRS